MRFSVRVLRGAQRDLQAQRSYVLQQFGAAVWNEALQELRHLLAQLAQFPEMGTPIRELESLGWLQFRQVLWRQVRVIYELRGDAVVVYMLLHSRRDFQTHLQRRLLG